MSQMSGIFIKFGMLIIIQCIQCRCSKNVDVRQIFWKWHRKVRLQISGAFQPDQLRSEQCCLFYHVSQPPCLLLWVCILGAEYRGLPISGWDILPRHEGHPGRKWTARLVRRRLRQRTRNHKEYSTITLTNPPPPRYEGVWEGVDVLAGILSYNHVG